MNAEKSAKTDVSVTAVFAIVGTTAESKMKESSFFVKHCDVKSVTVGLGSSPHCTANVTAHQIKVFNAIFHCFMASGVYRSKKRCCIYIKYEKIQS